MVFGSSLNENDFYLNNLFHGCHIFMPATATATALSRAFRPLLLMPWPKQQCEWVRWR